LTAIRPPFVNNPPLFNNPAKSINTRQQQPSPQPTFYQHAPTRSTSAFSALVNTKNKPYYYY
jgi:hypothetical protein